MRLTNLMGFNKEVRKLAESQQDLDAEYKAIVDKNFWELLGK